MAVIRRVAGERPVALGYWRTLAKLTGLRFSYEQSLSPALFEPERPASEFTTPDLRTLFAGRTVGSWSLDVETIEYVWKELKTQHPGVVIECGAGVSTQLFAAHYKRLGRGSPALPSVITLEQSLQIALSIEEQLRETDAGGLATVLVSPLDTRYAYSIDRSAMLAALAGRHADWVFVDGPSGPLGCRWKTLLDLKEYCRPGARWFLDDALRLDNLGVLSLWARYPGITVDGIIPIGKGLATGTVTAPCGS